MTAVRSLFVIATFAVTASAWSLFGKRDAAAEEECKYALEILALQDASASFASHVDRWAAAAEDLMDSLAAEFGEYKIALSSFTDKPIPRSGYGKYGGWGKFQQDYCYATHVPFTTSAEAMTEGLTELKGMIGAGFDAPEAQAEAMIYAAYDAAVGWSAKDVTHAESGRPIARIMLLITDAKSHEAGDASSNLGIWNAQRQYPNGYEHNSTGGFGATDFLETHLVYTADSADEQMYYEMSKLFAKRDGFEAGAGSALTDTESARLEELVKKFGPQVFPALKYKEHPGDNSTVSDCTQTEYPTLQQMITALQKMQILPIFLASTQEAYDFYEWYRVNVFEGMGIESVVSMFDSDTVFETMIESISKLVAKQCLQKTTEEPTTTTHPTHPAPGDAEGASKLETTSATDGGEPNHGSQAAEKTEDAPQDGTSTSVESTEEVVLVPPVVVPVETGHGGGAGVIAGASAGAVAGLAAIGGILYKTVGFTAFGGGAEAPMGVEQMETPENPVEREAMEEVTIDMFN